MRFVTLPSRQRIFYVIFYNCFAKFDGNPKGNGSKHENVLEFNFFIHLVTHFFKKVKIDVIEAPSLVQSCNGSKILYTNVTSASTFLSILVGVD